MSAGRTLAGLVLLSVLSLVLLHVWVIARFAGSGRGRRRRPSLRDLLPRVHLPQNHSLRNTTLWREDGRCGERFTLPAKALDGNVMYVPAGCNPKGAIPCCSEWGYCGDASYCTTAPNSVDYLHDDRAFDLQLLMLSQIRGPRARAFNLTGTEWRQDFLCGPGIMSMTWTSPRDVGIQQAACNPDSPHRYLCDLALSTCTDAKGVSVSDIGKTLSRPSTTTTMASQGGARSFAPTWGRHHGGGIRIAHRPDPAISIDYRVREHWETRQTLPVPIIFQIRKHMVHFETNTHEFASPGGGTGSMLLDGFSRPQNAPGMAVATSGTRMMAVTPPRWYFINMDTHREKGQRLQTSLLRGGVRSIDITRISAVTPKHIDDMGWTVPGTGKDVEKAVTLSHLRAIKRAWDDNQLRAKHGLPMMASMIVEDDISMELTGLWKNAAPSRRSITLYDVLRALEDEHTGWELVQLSMTCFTGDQCEAFIAEMAGALVHNAVVIPRKSRKQHKFLWGAVANLVSPKGQARILNQLWPMGSEGPAFEALPKGADFRIDAGASVVADSVLFQATRKDATFFSARPLFTSGTEHSHLHKDHLGPQERSKYLMESVLYVGKI